MLEPHIRNSTDATISQRGWVFLTQSLAFLIFTLCAGQISKCVPYYTILSIAGNLGQILGFSLIGPLPILPLEPSLDLIWVTVTITAFGLSHMTVSTFGRAEAAAARLFENQEASHHFIISSLFTSSLYLGQFLGSTFGGIVVDAIGFRNALYPVVGILTLMLAADTLELVYFMNNKIKNNRRSKQTQTAKNVEPANRP